MKMKWMLLLLALSVSACSDDDTSPKNPDAGTNQNDLNNVNNLNNPNNVNNQNNVNNLNNVNNVEPDMSLVEPDMNLVEPDMSSVDEDMGMSDDMGMNQADMSGPGACDENGFNVTESFAEAPEDGTSFYYEIFDGDVDNPPFKQFSFEIYNEFGGVVTTQSFTFSGESYADCGVCLLAFRCSTADQCDTFLAQKGDVTISQIGTNDGDMFEASFTDLEFAEVDVDMDTFETTPISGGDSWCIPSLTASETVTTF